MSIINIQFDLKIPTGWLVDPEASVENFTETLSVTYRGDDTCYVAVDENGDAPYGFGAVSEKEMNDGPPEQGEGYEWLEINCEENPIFCSLHADLDPALNIEEGGNPEPVMLDIDVTVGYEGYPSLSYNSLFEASDFYRTSQINIISNEPFLVPYTSITNLFGSDCTGVTWDIIREERDERLLESDKYLADDMPQELKDEVILYRKRLREMPTILADVPEHLAYDMMPDKPSFMVLAR